MRSEDDCQGADGGQRGCQYGEEGFQIVPPPDVIGHHDGIVDDKAQRDGDSGQRIQLHFQSEQIIEDHGDAQVYTQADDDQNQVTEIPGDHENEEQQDQNRIRMVSPVRT